MAKECWHWASIVGPVGVDVAVSDLNGEFLDFHLSAFNHRSGPGHRHGWWRITLLAMDSSTADGQDWARQGKTRAARHDERHGQGSLCVLVASAFADDTNSNRCCRRRSETVQGQGPAWRHGTQHRPSGGPSYPEQARSAGAERGKANPDQREFSLCGFLAWKLQGQPALRHGSCSWPWTGYLGMVLFDLSWLVPSQPAPSWLGPIIGLVPEMLHRSPSRR